jgi:hypothetical protein
LETLMPGGNGRFPALPLTGQKSMLLFLPQPEQSPHLSAAIAAKPAISSRRSRDRQPSENSAYAAAARFPPYARNP